MPNYHSASVTSPIQYAKKFAEQIEIKGNENAKVRFVEKQPFDTKSTKIILINKKHKTTLEIDQTDFKFPSLKSGSYTLQVHLETKSDGCINFLYRIMVK